jgi:hypothetical protein
MGDLVPARALDRLALDRAERDGRACRLRAQGRDWQEIAGECGYSSREAAQAAVRRALVETLRAPADELRAEQVVLHREAIRKCWDIISDPQPLLDRSGRPVTLEGDDGVEYAVADQGIQVQALTALQRFSESLRKMLGLDAPQRSVRVTLAELQEMALANGVPAAEVYGLPDQE